MTPEEAKELLLVHSLGYADLDHPKVAHGFLGSLRPFQGLNQENYREVMRAIYALAPEISAGKFVDKEVMSSLWFICFQSWAIGLMSGGALDRNQLISDAERVQLEEWLWQISFSVSILLEGGDPKDAFAGVDFLD